MLSLHNELSNIIKDEEISWIELVVFRDFNDSTRSEQRSIKNECVKQLSQVK